MLWLADRLWLAVDDWEGLCVSEGDSVPVTLGVEVWLDVPDELDDCVIEGVPDRLVL